MKIRFAFFALLCLFSPAALSSAAFAAPVRVAGVVFEETNNHPAANAVVELLRARDGQSTPIAKVRADGAGRFAFAPQNAETNELLVVRTNWTGYTYVAPAYDGSGQFMKQMNAKIDPANVRLSVYKTTTEIVPIDFMAHHLAIESKSGGLKCVERIVVQNPTKKTFLGLGQRRATILLNLPAAAKNVKLDPSITDGTLEKRPDGYAVIKPIPPTAYEPRSLVIVNYDMDWPSSLPWKRSVDFSRKIQYPTKFFFVARNSDEKRLEVVAPKLSAPQEAPLPINGQMETRTVNAIGQPMGGKPVLNAGDDLSIKVSSPVNPLFWGFLGFLILFCLAVPAALLRKNPPPTLQAAKIEEPPVSGSVYGGTLAADGPIQFSPNAFGIIESIARLDEEFAKGAVVQAEYTQRRGNLKNQIVEQLLQSDGVRRDLPKNNTQSNDSGA